MTLKPLVHPDVLKPSSWECHCPCQWSLLRPNLILLITRLQTGLPACWIPFKNRSSLLIAWADLYLESWNVLVSGGTRKMLELISKSIWADPTRTPSSEGCWSRSFWRLDLKELSGFPETGKKKKRSAPFCKDIFSEEDLVCSKTALGVSHARTRVKVGLVVLWHTSLGYLMANNSHEDHRWGSQARPTSS